MLSCLLLYYKHQTADCSVQTFSVAGLWVYTPVFTCVCSCVFVCAHASVICSHTYVSQRLHPAAPLSCCHGELPLAYSKCIGLCVCVCLSPCVLLPVLLWIDARAFLHACLRGGQCTHIQVWVCLFPFCKMCSEHMNMFVPACVL